MKLELREDVPKPLSLDFLKVALKESSNIRIFANISLEEEEDIKELLRKILLDNEGKD